MSSLKQTEKEIREAYMFLREKNNIIPSDTLQFMLDVSLEKLNAIKEKASKNISDIIENKDNDKTMFILPKKFSYNH